jgi:hypothetical protein
MKGTTSQRIDPASTLGLKLALLHDEAALERSSAPIETARDGWAAASQRRRPAP